MKGHQWIDNFVTVEVLHGFDELFVHVVLRSLAELHVVEPNLIKKGSESGKFFFLSHSSRLPQVSPLGWRG